MHVNPEGSAVRNHTEQQGYAWPPVIEKTTAMGFRTVEEVHVGSSAVVAMPVRSKEILEVLPKNLLHIGVLMIVNPVK